MQRNVEIDIMKGIAILCVMLGHSSWIPNGMMAGDYVSVLQDEIQQAGINVDAHQIVFRRLKQRSQEVCEWVKDGVRRKPTPPKIDEDSQPITMTPSEQETIARYGYDALKNEYEASGKSMDDFCIEKGINKVEFEKHIKSK